MFYRTYRVMLDIPVITKLLAFILAFFAPISLIVHALWLFLAIDAITSIYWQYRCKKKETNEMLDFKHSIMLLLVTIESRKLRRTVEKMLFYVIALMVFFLFDKIFLKIVPTLENTLSTFSVTNLAAILIGFVELTSIASNISKITNNPIFNKIISITQKRVEEKIVNND